MQSLIIACGPYKAGWWESSQSSTSGIWCAHSSSGLLRPQAPAVAAVDVAGLAVCCAHGSSPETMNTTGVKRLRPYGLVTPLPIHSPWTLPRPHKCF